MLPFGQPHISHVYAGDNRLTQVNKNGTITTYEYDLNGNRIADSSGSQYGYDEENLLAYAGKGDTVSTYGIGTDGLRNAKTTSDSSTNYVTAQDGNVIREGTDDIIRGHQALAKRTADGSYYYYIYNAHGDVVMLLDESGNVQNRYQYDAWGKITSETETVPNSIKYAGEYYDTETGFIYLRNRMYDPATRRFTSEDPARDQLNWYAYCGNNPVMMVDPWGETWELFDSFLSASDRARIEQLTIAYYEAGNMTDNEGNFLRDRYHNEAMSIRMKYISYESLGAAMKDISDLGISTYDSDYTQRVYEWALALELAGGANAVPRDRDGHIKAWYLNAMIGALKKDIQQVRSIARELNMTKDEEYKFQRWLEKEKQSNGMPAGYTYSYSELLELGHEFLGR